MNDLRGRTIVVGVCGGIAAYKSAELVSRLVQREAVVRVVMTRHATELVGPVTFHALSGNPVLTETFAAPEAYGMGHLSLAGSAEAVAVVPATANLLAKAAAGLADDLLSTTLVAVSCPVLFAPAMNSAMWQNAIVQRNVATLREAGCHFVGPGSGWLACRDEGAGRMSEPGEILVALRRLLWTPRDLIGRRVLITAGPTREPLDAVRYLSNPSTGKQGYALAEAALMRGAEVTLVTGPSHLAPPPGAEVVAVTTAAEMAGAVLARCAEADLVIGAAAVSDYTPASPAAGKPAKVEDGLTVALHTTEDIIAAVGQAKRPGQVVVAFAAETGDLVERATDKLRRKRADLIVANDVSASDAGFGTETNRVTLIGADGTAEELPPGSKLAVAHEVLRRAAALLPGG